jgi:ribulose-phosphate 3-epimerase
MKCKEGGSMELSASMMCARYDNLKQEIQELEEAGIDSFHIDMMDGMFVPNIGMGLQDIQCIRANTKKPLEVHLMVCNIMPYLDILKPLNINTIYIHPEADYHPFATLVKIKEMGIEPGIAVDPGTSVESVKELLNVSKKVLVMAVNPGRAGQAYLPYIEEKVECLVAMKEKYGFELTWDGACTKKRIREFGTNGVDSFVLGTGLLFGHEESYAQLIQAVRNLV